MQIVVQKFGGTSVQSTDSRKHVIKHIKESLNKNNKIIVVVSALGRKPDPYATDTLLDLVNFKKDRNNRELDLLMACGEIISSVVLSSELRDKNINTIALTGAQAGVLTTEDYNHAKIKMIQTGRIIEELKHNDVIVVAGFQGQTETGEITTIGRGGSDTSAAALATALQAEKIEIFSDVNGIMTADPKYVKTAKRLDVVSYLETCHLAYQGTKIVHPRAVEVAMHGKIPIHVRSTYKSDAGTIVTSSDKEQHISDQTITGIAHLTSISQIKVKTKSEIYRMQSEVFKAMAELGISIDFINILPTGVIYTVPEEFTDKAVQRLKILGFHPEVTKQCAKVSIVGSGMIGVPGVASRMVKALTNAGVQILQSADSHTTIWGLIHDKDLNTAMNALHDTFEF